MASHVEQVWSNSVEGKRRGCLWEESSEGFQPLQKSVENWGFVSDSGVSEFEEFE